MVRISLEHAIEAGWSPHPVVPLELRAVALLSIALSSLNQGALVVLHSYAQGLLHVFIG
jgi:hypothetical protein